MSKNVFLKKSKAYVTSVISFVIISLVMLSLVVLAVLSLFDILVLRDAIIKFIFAFLGFLLPIEKSAFEKLKNSSPWETYLNYLIRKEKLPTSTPIRISYAAHLVVEFNGKYLLLNNKYGINLFQFPSRTYPISEEEARNIKIKFDAREDTYIKKDFYDYRFMIPAKNLKSFYKYFCYNIDPYTYSCQHIVDDFVERCSLNKELFADVKYVFKQRKIKKIEYSRFTDSYEMNVADVYVFCPTNEQMKALVELEDVQSNMFKVATYEEVKRNGTNVEKGKLYADIAPLAYNLLSDSSYL